MLPGAEKWLTWHKNRAEMFPKAKKSSAQILDDADRLAVGNVIEVVTTVEGGKGDSNRKCKRLGILFEGKMKDSLENPD